MTECSFPPLRVISQCSNTQTADCGLQTGVTYRGEGGGGLSYKKDGVLARLTCVIFSCRNRVIIRLTGVIIRLDRVIFRLSSVIFRLARVIFRLNSVIVT